MRKVAPIKAQPHSPALMTTRINNYISDYESRGRKFESSRARFLFRIVSSHPPSPTASNCPSCVRVVRRTFNAPPRTWPPSWRPPAIDWELATPCPARCPDSALRPESAVPTALRIAEADAKPKRGVSGVQSGRRRGCTQRFTGTSAGGWHTLPGMAAPPSVRVHRPFVSMSTRPRPCCSNHQ